MPVVGIIRDLAEFIRDDFRYFRANRRAKKLFLANLSELQRDDMYQTGWFSVFGSHTKMRYMISVRGNLIYNIWRPEDELCFCFAPDGVPFWDAILAQKLMLECNELEVLKVANKGRIRSPI